VRKYCRGRDNDGGGHNDVRRDLDPDIGAFALEDFIPYKNQRTVWPQWAMCSAHGAIFIKPPLLPDAPVSSLVWTEPRISTKGHKLLLEICMDFAPKFSGLNHKIRQPANANDLLAEAFVVCDVVCRSQGVFPQRT